MIKGVSSKILELLAGVPQGSILGPLLFLIFINDIEVNLSSEVSLFADDTTLFKEFSNSKEVEKILNDDLTKIALWGLQNMVEFNANKTVVINFSLKRIRSDVILFSKTRK